MPVDGVVTEGTSEVDRALLTGESLPAFAGPGTAGQRGRGQPDRSADAAGDGGGADSSLHRMADLVAIAESAKTRYTSLADRAARLYSPRVHLLSFSAFGYWMWATGGDLRYRHQHLGGGADHHLPLRARAGRARRW